MAMAEIQEHKLRLAHSFHSSGYVINVYLLESNVSQIAKSITKGGEKFAGKERAESQGTKGRDTARGD